MIPPTVDFQQVGLPFTRGRSEHGKLTGLPVRFALGRGCATGVVGKAIARAPTAGPDSARNPMTPECVQRLGGWVGGGSKFQGKSLAAFSKEWYQGTVRPMEERPVQRSHSMQVDAVRAWKDPVYRNGLGAGEFALVPPNPAGVVEVTDAQLKEATGRAAAPVTTNLACTMYTLNRFRCCP
jgi:mersacidin/lichenicidin family type 2 lantibiotic